MAGDRGALDTWGPLTGAAVKGSQIDSESGLHLLAMEVSADEDGATIDGGDREGVYTALGAGGRPLPPESDGTAAEAMCVRASSGDLPVLGLRDRRIEGALEDEPAEGTIWHAGYHGAVLRFDVVGGEARSVVTVSDGAGRKLVLDDQGVRAPASPLIQGDPSAAKDVALADPLVALLVELKTVLVATAAALNTLAPGSVDLTSLLLKFAPYLVPAISPALAAPSTRAPDLRGAPGA